jgi:hypothetical protein
MGPETRAVIVDPDTDMSETEVENNLSRGIAGQEGSGADTTIEAELLSSVRELITAEVRQDPFLLKPL